MGCSRRCELEVVAKVEGYPGAACARVGFIGTTRVESVEWMAVVWKAK
jgi:hypothetical protein